MLRSIINKHGVEVNSGDFWTMESPANKYFPDMTWIMRIDYIQENTLVPVDYVNWKRKGQGRSYSRTINDFGGWSSLRRSTEEEVECFKRRFKK